MRILAHRGRWKTVSEHNSLASLRGAVTAGFGLETDLRDYKGDVVISHDIHYTDPLRLSAFLELLSGELTSGQYLALNIKSDGLQGPLLGSLKAFDIRNYFLFDMSLPEAIKYLREAANVFTRQSEYEQSPSFYEKANGVWLDEFHGHWITSETIEGHIANGKKVAIVSPELHGRDYAAEWEDYRKVCSRVDPDYLMICTDFPDFARDYFSV